MRWEVRSKQDLGAIRSRGPKILNVPAVGPIQHETIIGYSTIYNLSNKGEKSSKNAFFFLTPTKRTHI